MLTFKKVELNNFKTFKHAELDFENNGLSLIEGINHDSSSFNSNGGGKSSLLSALTYALFGKTGQANEKANDIVNREIGKNTSVVLTFNVDGTDYKIERYRKDKEHKNKVLLFENDTEITEKSAADTNLHIEEIIGMDYTIYTNTIMYGQDSNAKTFTEATDKEKKDILSDITRISVYAQAQQIVRDEQKETEQALINNEAEQGATKKDSEQVNQMAEQEKQDYKQTEESLSEHKDKLKLLSEDSAMQEQHASLNNLKESLAQLQDSPIQRYTVDKTSLDKMSEAKQAVKDKINEFNYKKKALNDDIIKLKNGQNTLNTATTCPTCGQPLDASHAQKEYENVSTQINTINKSIQEIDEGINTKLVIAENNIATKITQEKERLKQEEQQMNQDYEDYHRKVNEDTQIYNTTSNSVSTWLNQIEKEEEVLKTLESVPKPRDYSDKLEELAEYLQDLKDKNTELFKLKESQRKSIEVLSREGVQSIVLDGVTPFLNEHANEYLKELSGGTIKVDFTTQVETQKGDLKDKFEVAVENSVGANTYSGLSAGEKRRVDLSVALAIQDLIYDSARIKTNVSVYDETFEGLDTSASESAIQLLERKAEEIGNIYVITHNDNLKPLFNSVLTVEKTDGVSQVKNN